MHDSERTVVEQEPEIIQSCRWFVGDAERYCQAKMRRVILGTDLQEAVSRTLSLGKSPISQL